VKRLALAAVLLLAAVALAGALRPEGAAAVDAPSGDRTVTVTGTGSVSAVPDRARLTFGVESQGATAKAALAANAGEMRRLIDALRRSGARDVATQYVSVSPRYRESGIEIAGYTATNAVSVTIGVERAGALLDAGTAAGANQVSGPSLSRADAERLYREALTAAVADARERAGVLADAAGATVGRVLSLVEGGAEAPVLEAAKLAADTGTPIEAGSQETTAVVSVTFALA
jgi:uncharacterized protein YggE